MVNIEGTSMIVRTWQQTVKVIDPSLVWVATDDERIEEHCQEHGIQVVMTSPECLTGTDRVAEAAELLDIQCAINVQGDEPLMNPADIQKIWDLAAEEPETILNGFAAVESEDEWRNPSIPKVVVGFQDSLMYASRAGVPSTKSLEFTFSHKQICVYSFPRKALEAFASLGHKTLLEESEDIEILRFLEMGYPVRMVELSGDSMAVDSPEDLEVVREIVRSRG